MQQNKHRTQRKENGRSTTVRTRWPDGTPRSVNNAFTGDFPRPDTGPTRTQLLNAFDLKAKATKRERAA